MSDACAASLPPAGAPLIDHYASIARTSRAMLAAARAGDWDGVTRLEDDCRVLIDDLRREALRSPLPGAERRRRMQLLRAILADDAEIRARAEPWLQQLERVLHGAAAADGG